jgi:hypothetical protein
MAIKRKAQPSPEELTTKGRMATSGTVAAAAAMEPFQANLMGPDAGFDPIHTSLVDRVKQVQLGDLSHVESMLMSQAMALQTMFSSLARRAANQEYIQHQQSYLALAIKAQSASRATLAVLIELKQPRHPTFIAQANVAGGHQQINNAPPNAHTRNSTTSPNELLMEASHSINVDTGAQGQTRRANQELAIVEQVHSADHRCGYGTNLNIVFQSLHAA